MNSIGIFYYEILKKNYKYNSKLTTNLNLKATISENGAQNTAGGVATVIFLPNEETP